MDNVFNDGNCGMKWAVRPFEPISNTADLMTSQTDFPQSVQVPRTYCSRRSVNISGHSGADPSFLTWGATETILFEGSTTCQVPYKRDVGTYILLSRAV